MMKKITFLLLLQVVFTAMSQPSDHNYYKTVTINSSQVSGASDFTDFPMLFSVTDADLISVANGGHVDFDDGTDILFTSSDGLTQLEHEIESYDPVTGSLTAWVKVPTLGSAVDTDIRMYYGSPCATGAGSDVWNSAYQAVLHLNQDPSSSGPQMLDSTPNGNDGETEGAMASGDLVDTKIGQGLSFDEVDDAVSIPDFDYASSNAFSMSFWFNVADNTGTAYQYMFSHGSYGVVNSLNTYFGEASLSITDDQGILKTIFQDNNDATSTDGLDATALYADGNWHYYVFSVAPLGTSRVYVDGVEIANIPFQGGDSYNPTTDIYLGARSDLNAARYYGGLLDEFRLMNELRTADFIATEFNNQNNPSSFYTLGTENNTGNTCPPLPVELIDFNVYPKEGPKVELEWKTSQEINNDFFEVQRSKNGMAWDDLKQVQGAGNTTQLSVYEEVDETPYDGTSYYRLKQVDVDGSYTYSPVRSVNFHGIEIVNTYPNPSVGIVSISINSTVESEAEIYLFDVIGRKLQRHEFVLDKGFSSFQLNTESLPTGGYVLKIQSKDGIHHDESVIQVR